jgi:hypothetical protein
MRHLWSLLSGIAATLTALTLLSIDHDDLSSQVLFGRLVVVGLVLGLVAATRISPVGPIVGGLILLAPAITLKVSYDLYAAVFLNGYGADLGGLHMSWDELSLTMGFTAMAGAMMIVAAISRQRWRAWPKPGFDSLVDNGRIEGLDPWTRRSTDDTVPTPTGAHDGTTAQLWVPPPPR